MYKESRDKFCNELFDSKKMWLVVGEKTQKIEWISMKAIKKIRSLFKIDGFFRRKTNQLRAEFKERVEFSREDEKILEKVVSNEEFII